MCPDEKMLTEYIDNELDAEYKNLIEKHLAICDKCTSYIQQAEILKKNMQESVHKIDIENSLSRVWASLNTVPVKKDIFSPGVKLTVLRAAILVVLISTGFIIGRITVNTSSERFAIPAQSFELKEKKLKEVTDYLYNNNSSQTENDAAIVITETELQQLVDLLSSRSAVMEVKISLPKEPDFSIIGQPELLRSSDIKRRKE